MITESEYNWYPPSAWCQYTGYPIPELDKADTTAVIKKEDICYLGDWMKDIRCTFYYGYKNSSAQPNFDGYSEYYGPRTDKWLRAAVDDLIQNMKKNYCLSCGTNTSTTNLDAYQGNLCPFTLGDSSWDDYVGQFASWHSHYKYGSDSTGEDTGFSYVPTPESRLKEYKLSNLFNDSGLTGFNQYNYYQYSNLPNDDVFRMCYWNMNRLSCVSFCGTAFENTVPSYIDGSIKGFIWYYKPWTTSYNNQCIRGPFADDTTIDYVTDTYLSGNYLSSRTETVKMQSSSGYVPRGDPIHGIAPRCTYTNPSLWTQIPTRSSKYQYIYSYKNGNPHYIVTPMLKGKIKNLAIVYNMRAESLKSSYSSSSSNYYVNMWKVFPLTKVDDHEGYETWEDTSGYWNDTKNMLNDMKKGILETTGWSDVYSFSGMTYGVGGVLMQLDTDAWRYWFSDWKWQPKDFT